MNILTITKEVENKVQITLEGESTPTKFFSIESLAEEIVRLHAANQDYKKRLLDLIQENEKLKAGKEQHGLDS